jgi:predicted DNA binding CopG/RHH family protein
MKQIKLTPEEQNIEDNLIGVLDKSQLTSKDRLEFERAAKRSIQARAAKTERVTLRISKADIEGLKIRAAETGIPYQTLAVAALHQFATGRLRMEFVER